MNPGERRAKLRFALPSSLGRGVDLRLGELRQFFGQRLNRDAEVVLPASYEHLARELLSGRVDAALAPPFVCARLEAMGVRILVRGVLQGKSTYRAALVCRKTSTLELSTLSGSTAAWCDRDSVGGFLLPMALLRERGIDPATTFHRQEFTGNYRAALEAVLAETADVTSIFAPSNGETTGLKEIWPEEAESFRVLAFTAETPNVGVAVSMNAPASLVSDLERCLLSMHESAEGARLLEACFLPSASRWPLAWRTGRSTASPWLASESLLSARGVPVPAARRVSHARRSEERRRRRD